MVREAQKEAKKTHEYQRTKMSEGKFFAAMGSAPKSAAPSPVPAGDKEAGEEQEEEEAAQKVVLPPFIKVEVGDRDCFNLFLYIIYKIFRVSFVGFWFYFVPFFAMILSYSVPWFMAKNYPLAEDGGSE